MTVSDSKIAAEGVSVFLSSLVQKEPEKTAKDVFF